MGHHSFAGLWVPLVTPFREGQVDLLALRRLVAHLANAGVTGFVVCGSTGEAAALSHSEQLQVLDTVLATCAGKPVLMGLAGIQATEMRERLHAFAQRPLAGVLISAPAYVRPSQAGIVAHFLALADASPVPVVLYDIPSRTGTTMTLETLQTLAEHPRILAIKDCGGDAEKTRRLIDDGRLQVLAGDDDQIFPTMCMGGAGAIAASAHLQTQHFVAMVEALLQADLARARRLYHALVPLTHALFAEASPGPIKAVLAQQGWLAHELRPPHTAATPEGARRALAADAEARRLLEAV